MGFAARTYSAPDEYWRNFNATVPGCVILDVHATVDGHSMQELLARQPLSPPVVVISASMEVQQVVRAMRRGAVDFLQKRSYSELDLWEALQHALTLDAANRERFFQVQADREKLALLSEPECDVLRRLLQGDNNRQIAELLGISRAAVEARRIRLMRKLGVTNMIALVNFAITTGFDA